MVWIVAMEASGSRVGRNRKQGAEVVLYVGKEDRRQDMWLLWQNK